MVADQVVIFHLNYIIFREQGTYKLLLAENLQVVNPLSYSYEFYRHLELIDYAYHYAALRCSVEFGDGHGCDVSRP